MFDGKLWLLISNESDESLKFYTSFIQGQALDAFRNIRLLMIEKLVCGVRDNGELWFKYEGEELLPPKYFYPAVTDTDAYLVENMLLQYGSKSIVDFEETRKLRSKILVYQRLVNAGIPTPKTNLFSNQSAIEDVVEGLEFPIVIKPDNGQCGEGVILVKTEEELSHYLSKLKYGDMRISQEYVASSKGRSLRVTTMCGKAAFAETMQASSETEFRSNAHLGGVFTSVIPDEKAAALAEKAASLCSLPLIGVDLLYTDSGYTVAEINSFPGLAKKEYVDMAYDAVFGRGGWQ